MKIRNAKFSSFQNGFGTLLFEDIATKIYDSLDWHRQYANYLTNINLLHVAEFGKEEKTPVPEEATTPIPAVSSQQGIFCDDFIEFIRKRQL